MIFQKDKQSMSSLVTKAWGLRDNVWRGSHDERVVLEQWEGAHLTLLSYKLLPKALKGKMNVAVILNPGVQLYML